MAGQEARPATTRGRGLGPRARLALVAGLLAVSLATLRTFDPAPLPLARDIAFDFYQRLAPRPVAEDLPVRVAAIDEAALAAYGQWPWPRTRIAQVIDRLAELGAGTVALAVLFPEPDRTTPWRLAGELRPEDPEEARRLAEILRSMPDHDAVLAETIARVPTVTGFALTPVPSAARPSPKGGFVTAGSDPAAFLPPFSGAVTNLDRLDAGAAGTGGLDLSARDGDIVRRLPLVFSDGERLYPSLVLEALRVAQGERSVLVRATGASREAQAGAAALVGLRVGAFHAPVTAAGELWLHFSADPGRRLVSVRDILDPSKEAAIRPLVEGHVVFLGTSAAGLSAARATPLGGSVPAVAIHAEAAEQILAQTFLARPDWAAGAEILATLALAALGTLALMLGGSRVALPTAFLVSAGAAVASWTAFRAYGLLIDPIFPVLSVLAVQFAGTALLYLTADQDKRFVREAFSQYVAPELLQHLERSPAAMRLGGDIRPLSIMFMDVRDFTGISESLSPTELVAFLNTLLSPLSDAILEERGTIDKYIGDSIMAFWNAPLEVAGHPAHACRAALRMRAIVEDLNARDAFGFRSGGLGTPPASIGIGINTGEACIGNMGSRRRFNYSAIGDAVNVAARIESSCRSLGVDILVSQATAAQATGFAFLEAGEIALKGKSAPVRLFALVGDEATAADPAFQALAEAHDAYLAALRRNDRDGALAALATCRALAAGGPVADFHGALALRLVRAPEDAPGTAEQAAHGST